MNYISTLHKHVSLSKFFGQNSRFPSVYLFNFITNKFFKTRTRILEISKHHTYIPCRNMLKSLAFYLHRAVN